MSRKTYKLNEIEEYDAAYTSTMYGKLRFVIDQNPRGIVDVYEGTELYSKVHGKDGIGKLLYFESDDKGRKIIVIEYTDGSTVVCFTESGKILYYKKRQSINRTKKIGNENYYVISRNGKCNVFDIDGNQYINDWYSFVDILDYNLFFAQNGTRPGKFFNRKGELLLDGARPDPYESELKINGTKLFVIDKLDTSGFIKNVMTNDGKILLDEWSTKDIALLNVETREGKLRSDPKDRSYICAISQNPNKIGKLIYTYRIYYYNKDKKEAIRVSDDTITNLARKYVKNKDIIIAWDDNKKMNILGTDGFVFDEFIDQIYINHIGITLEEWQEDFIKSGLIVCENDGKYNLVENSTDVKMFDSFVDNVIKQENIFNDYQPLILIKYADNACDIASISDLKPEFNASLSDILENSDGFIFFTMGKNKYLYMGEDKYVECENCINSYYGICIKKEYGYMFEFNGKFSSTYDNVYDIDSLFPIVEIDGKYNFFDWAICKVCFNEWFDDVEPYDAKYMKGIMDSGERGYNRKGGHEFTVYKTGKREQVGYFPDKNFGIA